MSKWNTPSGLLVLCLFVCSNCQHSTKNEELGVYSSYSDKYLMEDLVYHLPYDIVVLSDHTVELPCFIIEDFSRLSPHPNPSTISNFLIRNGAQHLAHLTSSDCNGSIHGTAYPIKNKIVSRANLVFIPASAINEEYNRIPWPEICKRHGIPNPQLNHGPVILSRIGFNEQRTEALLYVEDHAAGVGALFLFMATSTGWTERASVGCWVS